MIRAVCFDMDGLLLDTERIGCEVTCALAVEGGCALTEAQRSQLMGTTLRRARELLESWFPGFDSNFIRERWYNGVLDRIRHDGLCFKPYAREVLDKLRQRGLKLALTSSNARQMVETYLKLAGWENAFDMVLTGHDVEKSKPDPEIYLLAAEKLGLAPTECAGVEDSYGGVQAVHAAGMLSIMIPDLRPYCEELAPYVDRVLEDLSQLEACIAGFDMAHEALTHYGLQDASLRFIHHNENLTFQVDDRFLLRVHLNAAGFCSMSSGSWPDDMTLRQTELYFLRFLRQSSLTVQQPVPDAKGNTIIRLADGTPATLLTWLPGHTPGSQDARPEVYQAAGAMLAQLHAASRTFPPCPCRRYDAAYCLHLADLFARSAIAADDRALLCQTCRTVADRLAQAEDNFLLLHGDLTSSNLILTPMGPAPIDFSLLGYGHPMFDLAALLSFSSGDADYHPSVIRGYVLSGGSVELPLLDACYVLSILSCIALHLGSWPDEDWFPITMARWRTCFFEPLNEGKSLFSNTYTMITHKER